MFNWGWRLWWTAGGGEAKTDQEAHMDNGILIAWSSKVERDVKQQVVSCCIKKVAKILVQNMHDNILHMFDYLLAWSCC